GPGRLHGPLLQPLRRPACRPGRAVGLAAFRADAARRLVVRARHGRQQGRAGGPPGGGPRVARRRGRASDRRPLGRRGRGGDRQYELRPDRPPQRRAVGGRRRAVGGRLRPASRRPAGGRARLQGSTGCTSRREDARDGRAFLVRARCAGHGVAPRAGSSEGEELREMLGRDEFTDRLSGAALWERVSFQPTSNLAGIDSGYSGPGIKTVPPAVASAWMDFRLVPEQQPEDILELLRAHLDREGFAEIQVTPIVTARAAKTPLADPFVRRVVDVAEAVSGESASIIPLAPPTLPIVASLHEHLALPGLAAPDNPTYTGSPAPAPNQHLPLHDIEPALRLTNSVPSSLGPS